MTDVVPQISVHDAAASMANGAAILDVREAHEWGQAHIAGAIHLPLRKVPEKWHDLPQDGPILVLCAVGARSQMAAQFLRQHGLDARNIVGGIMAWHRAGLAVEMHGS